MYSAEQTKQLQKETEKFQLQEQVNESDINDLRAVLRFHEYRYYVLNDPLIDDTAYDFLFKKLEKLEGENPLLITPDSPTQRVGSSLNASFPTVQHLVPMLSLDNSYNAEDLLDFDRKARELTGLDIIEYCIEPKFDGASISLIYENDLFVRGATRGDGVEGEDVTTNIKRIRSIPLSAPFSRYGIEQIEIRGEILMTKAAFKKYNDGLAEQGLPPLANPRNAASGSLRIKDPKIVGKRNLEAFLYNVSYYTTVGSSYKEVDSSQLTVDRKKNTDDSSYKEVDSSQLTVDRKKNTDDSSYKEVYSSQLTVARKKGEGQEPDAESVNSQLSTVNSSLLDSHSGTLQMLWECGFRSPQKEKQVVKGIDEVIKHVHDFEEMRDTLPYEIDGMVIKVNEVELQDKMGMTTHHPRWAIAFKFKARQATTKLRGVEFQVGRTGAVTPVAKLQPVALGGVTVGSISIHNEDYIKEKDLMVGDSVLIERAGDVIPQIVKSLPELRTGEEQPIVYLTKCPACQSQLVRPEGEAVWRCINIECPAQVVERMIHFVSKDAMDIKSFGEANVRKFYELGLLKDVPGIYELNFEEIGKQEGFGKKSIDNLKAAIEASKQQPLHRVIYALGIRYVGETTAKTVANAIHDVFELESKTEEDLKQMEDIGVKVAQSIYTFFQNKENIKMLEKLKELGLQMQNQKRSTAAEKNTLNEQTFLFTGTLLKLKRAEAEEIVEKHGGKIVSGVSSKLNYLVVGEDAGSKLEKAKKINTVKIITEDEFIAMVGA